MTIEEFKAWLEGFEEAINHAPTDTQWKKIKKRIEQIDDTRTSAPIFIDRYVEKTIPYWNDLKLQYWKAGTPYISNAIGTGAQAVCFNAASTNGGYASAMNDGRTTGPEAYVGQTYNKSDPLPLAALQQPVGLDAFKKLGELEAKAA